ncbi:MAG: energy-coupling factor transporter transmembrane protein EcfT [Marinisporobacter sp.]|nr:energy-coupling factor transporter transmembrane protein EcfT [Marinisporobacter sp.]
MVIQSLNKKKFHLDPRTKILIMAIISTCEMLMSDNISFMIVVAAIPFILLMINKQYKFGIWFGVLFSLSLIAKEVQNFIHFNIVINMFIIFLVGVVLRLFPAFAMGTYVINSTKASEFVSAMGKMHITRKFTIPVSIIFRFLPTMGEESSSIKAAMKMRGIEFGTKKFWQNPITFIEYRFIPLIVSVVKIGDELSAAALTRGLDNPVTRTNITKIRFTANDFMAITFSIALLLFSFFAFR